MPPSRRRVAAALVSVVLVAGVSVLLAGIGGREAPDAREVLRQTFTGSHRVDSGRVAVALTFGALVDVRLAGRFQRRAGALPPKVSLALSGRARGRRVEASLTATDGQLFVGRGGRQYLAPPAAFARLEQGYAQGLRQGASKGLLDRLGVTLRWLREPKLVGEATIDGTATTHVRAAVDVRALVGDLAGLTARARRLGLPAGRIAQLGPRARAELLRTVRSASVNVFTGREDRTLRRMAVVMRLRSGAAAPAPSVASTDATFSIDLAQLNRPQAIVAPAGARPLPGGGGLPGPGAAAGSAPPAGRQRYTRCIRRARGDVARAQRCAGLLAA